jgi:hypothetical protein
VDPIRAEALDRCGVFRRPADRDCTERRHGRGQIQEHAQRQHPLGARADTDPHRAQAEGVTGQQDVLGRGRAALDPAARMLLLTDVGADDDAQGRLPEHLAKLQHPCQTVKMFPCTPGRSDPAASRSRPGSGAPAPAPRYSSLSFYGLADVMMPIQRAMMGKWMRCCPLAATVAGSENQTPTLPVPSTAWTRYSN